MKTKKPKRKYNCFMILVSPNLSSMTFEILDEDKIINYVRSWEKRAMIKIITGGEMHCIDLSKFSMMKIVKEEIKR